MEKKYNGGCWGLEREGNRYYCLMGMDFHLGKMKKFSDGWLHNNVNAFNATELYTLK